MRRPPARCILALAIVASPLGAQSAPKAAMGKAVPVSDIRSDYLGGGAESPNGRFYLLTSYASNDSGFLRFDRVKRSWAHLGPGNFGLGVRWSPNGRFVLFGKGSEESRERYVWVMPMDTVTGLAGGPARRVSMRSSNTPATWSPDSRRVAFTARDSSGAMLVTVPFNGGDEQVVYRAPGVFSFVVWSPDSRYLFTNHSAPNRAPRTVRISLADKSVVDLGDAKAPIIDISPDGKWLAQYRRSPVLHLLSTDGKSERSIDFPEGLKERLEPSGWSHTNPNQMVALDHIVPTGIQRVSIADGRIRTVVGFDSAGLAGSALSPDGRQLAYSRLHDGVIQLVLSDTNGANVRVLLDGARNAEWSPTGEHIAYSATNGNDVRVVEVASRKIRELIPTESVPCGNRGPNCDGRASSFTWRSDGRAIRYFERRATKDGHAIELREVDLDGRQRVVATTTVSGSPSFIPRNDTLFLVQQPGPGNGTGSSIQLVNSRTGAARVIYSGVTRMSHPDASGQWILLVAESGGNSTPLLEQPLLVSLTTGESKKYPYALGGEVSHGYFLPDGRNFLLTACVTCREPNYVEKWDLILTPMNGDPPRILTGPESNFKDFWEIGFTKDGRTLYFTAQESYNTRLVTIALPKF